MSPINKRFAAIYSLLALWLLLFTGINTAHAEPFKYVSSYGASERSALAAWVQDKTKNKVSAAKSRKYVDQAYLHAFANELDPLVILAMMRVESNFNERAKSFVGALGLMQVWPKWHKAKLKGRDPYNTAVNTEVGSAILKDCWVMKAKVSIKKVFECYSGGAKKYEAKVRREHAEIMQVVLAARAAPSIEPQGSAEDAAVAVNALPQSPSVPTNADQLLYEQLITTLNSDTPKKPVQAIIESINTQELPRINQET